MAFFHDMRPSREPFLIAPAIIFWLIGAIVVAHVARVLAPPPWPEFLLFEFSFIPARFSESAIATSGMPVPNLGGQVVPFVSYMFLHGDYTHLAMNCLWLLAFGPIVAKRLGTGKFLLFFLFCGVISAAAHLAVYFGAVEQVVGASGAIAGLMGAGMRIFYGRLAFGRKLPPGETVPIAPLFSRPIIVFTAIWMIGNFVAGATGLGLATPGASVAWVAHIGGYFAGLLGITAFDRVPFGASAARHRA